MNRKGFTLIELLITIVVISLVAGITIFGIIPLFDNAKENTSNISIQSVKDAAIVYSSENINEWHQVQVDETNKYFCVTIQELINKGLISKNVLNNNNLFFNSYIMIKKDKKTSVVKEPLLVDEYNEEDYTKYCSEEIVNVPILIKYYPNSNSNQVSNIPDFQSTTIGENINLSSNVPVRNGYSFEGWDTKADGTGTRYNPNQVYLANDNLTLYAIWNIKTYTITYNANGGTGAPSNQIKEYGKSIQLSNKVPTKTGFTFDKWNTKADGTGTNYNSNGTYSNNANVTLYAKWNLKTYTITYNANGGTVIPVSKNVEYNSKYGYLPTPTRTGYTFIGWFDYSYKDSPLRYYADTYSDLKNTFGYNENQLYNHYINHGKNENRRISQYLSTDTFNSTQNITLYAGWLKNITAPSIKLVVTNTNNNLEIASTTITSSNDINNPYIIPNWINSAISLKFIITDNGGSTIKNTGVFSYNDAFSSGVDKNLNGTENITITGNNLFQRNINSSGNRYFSFKACNVDNKCTTMYINIKIDTQVPVIKYEGLGTNESGTSDNNRRLFSCTTLSGVQRFHGENMVGNQKNIGTVSTSIFNYWWGSGNQRTPITLTCTNNANNMVSYTYEIASTSYKYCACDVRSDVHNSVLPYCNNWNNSISCGGKTVPLFTNCQNIAGGQMQYCFNVERTGYVSNEILRKN